MMEIRLIAYDRLGTRRGVVPNPLEINLTKSQNDLSVLALHYDISSPMDYAILDNTPEIAVETFINNAWVETRDARLRLLTIDFDHLSDIPTRRYDFIGIGEALKGATVYGAYGLPLNDDGNPQFKLATPGKILKTIWDNAVSRGWKGFSYSFNATTDSNGQAWANTFTISYKVDQNLLGILAALVAQGVVDYSWSGRTLNVYNSNAYLARDLTVGPNPLRLAGAGLLGIDAAPENEDRSNLASHIIVIGENNLRWEFPTGTILPEGRREIVLTYSGVDDIATAQLLANPVILKAQNYTKNTTRQFHLNSSTTLEPYRDFDTGDWVNVLRGTGFERMRIYSLNVQKNSNGTQGYVMLGDKVDDLLSIMYQRIQGLTGGVANEGGAPVAAKGRKPVAPTGLAVTSGVYIDKDGLTQGSISANWAHTGKDTTGLDVLVTEYIVHYRPNGTTAWKRLFVTTGEKSGAASPITVYDAVLDPYVYQIKVTAVSAAGIYSDPSSIVSLTMTQDTTPPPVPTTPTVTTWLRTNSIKWDGLGRTTVNVTMPPDFAYAKVWEATNSQMTGATVVDRLEGTTLSTIVGPRTAGTTYWYALSAVDNSGNESAKTTPVSVMPTNNVDMAEILNKLDAATVALTNVGTASLVDKAITTAKLNDNAVSQAKLADQAVTLAKLDTVANDKITKGINDAAAASSAALAADGKAGTAQLAADAAKRVADAAVASGANLVTNGGFETDDVWPTGALNLYDTAEKRSGARSFKLTPSGGNLWPVSGWVDGATGRTYRYEYWIKKSGTDPIISSIGGVLQAKTTAGGTATLTIFGTPNKAADISTTEFTKVTIDYTVTTADTVQVRFAPWVKQCANTYWIDDFTVTDITDAKAALDAAKAAQEKADTAFADAQSALTNAGLAQTAANGKARVFYTNTAPSGTGYSSGDIWFRGTDNKVHVWDTTGTPQWVAKADTAIATAQQAANDASLLATSVVKTSTMDATGIPMSSSALWVKTNSDGSLAIKTWTSNAAGTAWVERKLDDAVIGNLNAATINAGTLNAARYNAVDIRAKFLEAGKVTAADMVTGTITAASGVIGSLDIGKVTTGALDGIYIKTQTLGTRHLMVSDLASFAPSPAESPADWAMGTGMFIGTTGSSVDGTTFAAPLGTLNAQAVAWGPLTMVAPGDDLHAEAKIARVNGFTGNMSLRWYFYDKDRLNGTYASQAQPASSPSGTLFTADAVVPAGKAYARVAAVINLDPANYGHMYDVRAYKKTGSVYISDGAITADKVAVNAVQAKNIVVGDFQNFALGSDFEDPAAIPWSLSPNHYRFTSLSKFGTACLFLKADSVISKSRLLTDLRVREGEQYNFKLWARLDVGFTGATANTKFRIGNQSNSALTEIRLDNLPSRGVWHPLELTYTIPAGVTALTIELWSDHTGFAGYVDEIQIRRVAEASLIQNLGVEKLVASSAAIDSGVIDKLWADVVNSRKITTDMLIVSGDNMMPDPFFFDATQNTYRLTSTSAPVTLQPDDASNANTLKVNEHTVSQRIVLNSTAALIKVIPGEVYNFRMPYRLRGNIIAGQPASTVRFSVYQHSPDGSYLSWAQVGSSAKTLAGTGPTWAEYSEEWTAPASIGWIRLAVDNINQSYSGEFEIKMPQVSRKADADLIVNGGILTNHLTVDDTMWAKIIKFKQLSGNEIDVNSLTSDTAWIGTLRGGVLTTDSVTSTNIHATNGITSKHTITGATIQTATSGRRVRLDTTGIKIYDASGATVISQNSTTGDMIMRGNIESRAVGGNSLWLGADMTESGAPGVPAKPGLVFGTTTTESAAPAFYRDGTYGALRMDSPYSNNGTATARSVLMSSNSGIFAWAWRSGQTAGPGVANTHKLYIGTADDWWIGGGKPGVADDGRIVYATDTTFQARRNSSHYFALLSSRATWLETSRFDISGPLYATAKNFRIPHPLHPETKSLVHGSTESPLAGVEYWGEGTLDADGSAIIFLPEYFEALTKQQNRAILVTPKDIVDLLAVTDIYNGSFTVTGTAGQRFTWLVKAEREGADFDAVEEAPFQEAVPEAPVATEPVADIAPDDIFADQDPSIFDPIPEEPEDPISE
jgi:hypothetical protein